MSTENNSNSHDNTRINQQHWQQVLNLDELRVSSIFTRQKISQFEGGAFPTGKSNLMASSLNKQLIFLALGGVINVYSIPEFSSKTPPDPASFFPFTPLEVLRPTTDQYRTILTRATDRNFFTFNHIRSGWIGEQESLVAVGEFGVILVWNLSDLKADPVMLEPADFESTWGIAMSPKSSILATSSNSHSITLFDFSTRRVLYHDPADVKINEHNIPSLDFSPCGRLLVSCSINGVVALWSLTDDQVKKMKSPSREWGWLVRFVPSQQYDQRTGASQGQLTKSFYHSGVEEVPFTEDDDDDILAPYYRYEETDEEEEDDDDDDDDDEEEDQLMTLPSVDYPVQASFNFTTIQGAGHLAEGAGDTWPSDDESELSDTETESETEYNESDTEHSDTETSEITNDGDEDDDEDEEEDDDEDDDHDDDEAENDEDDDRDDDDDDEEDEDDDHDDDDMMSDYDSYDSEITCSMCPGYHRRHRSEDLDDGFEDDSYDYYDEFSDYSDDYESDNSDYASDDDEESESETSEFSVETIKIDLQADELFKTRTQSTAPLDIFYCTAKSIFVIDTDGKIKLQFANVKKTISEQQGHEESYSDMMRFLQDRLAMGEWIVELGVFLVIDCNGHIFISSPKASNQALDLATTIMVPDTPKMRSEIVGYTLVRREDEEFGIKMHLYVVCCDGTFMLYEIVKKQQE